MFMKLDLGSMSAEIKPANRERWERAGILFTIPAAAGPMREERCVLISTNAQLRALAEFILAFVGDG